MADSNFQQTSTTIGRVGRVLFGIGSVASGILDIIWREFEPAHRPIQAWGDHIPGLMFLVYAAGVLLIVAGAAIVPSRTARWGAFALAVLYGIFAIFPLPRLVTAPRLLGHHFPVYVGVCASIAQQLILAAGSAAAAMALRKGTLHSGPKAGLVRLTFGLCAVDFGLAHLTGVQAVAVMVPRWMPLGTTFWTIFTGTAFLIAGLAILIRKYDVVAAHCLGLMLLVFSALVLLPRLLTNSHSHITWGSNAYNLAAAGAAWMFAEWAALRPAHQRAHEHAGP